MVRRASMMQRWFKCKMQYMLVSFLYTSLAPRIVKGMVWSFNVLYISIPNANMEQSARWVSREMAELMRCWWWRDDDGGRSARCLVITCAHRLFAYIASRVGLAISDAALHQRVVLDSSLKKNTEANRFRLHIKSIYGGFWGEMGKMYIQIYNGFWSGELKWKKIRLLLKRSI